MLDHNKKKERVYAQNIDDSCYQKMVFIDFDSKILKLVAWKNQLQMLLRLVESGL